jgi:hypothetical protein
MIDQLPETMLGQDTSCVQMFMCKLEPAFWSIQTTSKNYEAFTLSRSMTSNLNQWLDRVYINLPDLRSLRYLGSRCNDKYPECQLIRVF